MFYLIPVSYTHLDVYKRQALGAISEDPSALGKSLIFVGLAEGVCLYGLIISFMIIGKLG